MLYKMPPRQSSRAPDSNPGTARSAASSTAKRQRTKQPADEPPVEEAVNEEVRRHRHLFLCALDPAVVSSGMMTKDDILNLCLASRTVRDIVRQRVPAAIGGGPEVIEHLSKYPGARELTVSFRDTLGPKSGAPVRWRVKESTLSQAASAAAGIQRMTICTWSVNRYKLIKGYVAKDDPFETMIPFLPSGLTSLNLKHSSDKFLAGINNILYHAPLHQSLLHLSIASKVGIGHVLPALLEVIGNMRNLQLLTVKNEYADDVDTTTQDVATRFMLTAASQKVLPQLTSFALEVSLGHDFQEASLCGLVGESDLLRFTKFTISNNPAFHLLGRFFTANNHTWQLAGFGATLLISNKMGTSDKGGYDTVKVVGAALERGLRDGPIGLRPRFLQAILSLRNYYRDGPESGVVEGNSPEWSRYVGYVAAVVESILVMECPGLGPLTSILLSWLVADGRTCSCLFKEQGLHLPILLPRVYSVAISPTSAAASRRVTASILVQALYHATAETVELATGSSLVDLLVLILRVWSCYGLTNQATERMLSTFLNRMKASDRKSLLDTYRLGHDSSGGSPSRRVMWRPEAAYLCRLLLLHPRDTRLGLLREEMVLEMALVDLTADELTRPHGLWDLSRVHRLLCPDSHPPDVYSSCLVNALLKPDRWDKTWAIIASGVVMRDKWTAQWSVRKDSRSVLVYILKAVWQRSDVPQRLEGLDDKSKTDISMALLDLPKLQRKNEMAFAKWVVTFLWDTPQAYFTSMVNHFVSSIKRGKTGTLYGMNQTLMGHIMCAFTLVEENASSSSRVAPSSAVNALLDIMGMDMVNRAGQLLFKCFEEKVWFGHADLLFKAVACLIRSSRRFASLVVHQDAKLKDNVLFLVAHAYAWITKRSDAPLRHATLEACKALVSQLREEGVDSLKMLGDIEAPARVWGEVDLYKAVTSILDAVRGSFTAPPLLDFLKNREKSACLTAFLTTKDLMSLSQSCRDLEGYRPKDLSNLTIIAHPTPSAAREETLIQLLVDNPGITHITILNPRVLMVLRVYGAWTLLPKLKSLRVAIPASAAVSGCGSKDELEYLAGLMSDGRMRGLEEIMLDGVEGLGFILRALGAGACPRLMKLEATTGALREVKLCGSDITQAIQELLTGGVKAADGSAAR